MEALVCTADSGMRVVADTARINWRSESDGRKEYLSPAGWCNRVGSELEDHLQRKLDLAVCSRTHEGTVLTGNGRADRPKILILTTCRIG